MAIADTFSNLGTAIINYVNRKTGPATTSKLGQVKPDGTTITVDANGVISSAAEGGSGLDMFDVVQKDHILTYEDTEGFAPLGSYVYKEAVVGKRYGYPDFYDTCVAEYNDANNTVEHEYIRSNITHIGDLIDNSGILSNFSGKNYGVLNTPIPFSTANTLDIILKFNITNPTAISTVLGNNADGPNGGGVCWRNEAGSARIKCWMTTNNSSWTTNAFDTGIDWTEGVQYMRLSYDGSAYTFYKSFDGSKWTAGNAVTSSRLTNHVESRLGVMAGLHPTQGQLDLTGSYININGSRWWTGADVLTYKHNVNGHSFYDIAHKALVDEDYEEHEHAWFYGVDTANKRVFLPRRKHGELVKSWNSDHEWYRIYQDGWCEQGGRYNGTVDGWTATHFYHSYIREPNVVITRIGTSGDDSGGVDRRMIMARDISLDHFNAWGVWAGYKFEWRASGYVEEPKQVFYDYLCVGNKKQNTAWINLVEEVNDSVAEINAVKNNGISEITTVKNNAVNEIGGVTHFVARSIGEIVTSSTPLNEAGLHLLDGSVIANGSYAQFVSHMASLYASNPSLFVTESEWQAAISAHGVCGKFVYDSAKKTVRLPKVTGIIEGTTDLSALGDLIEAGLPNITGGFNGNELWDGNFYTTGCFTQNSGVSRQTGGGGDSSQPGIGFDASRSNPIYGKSNTVQPQTIKVLYYIVVAQSAKTELQVNIDNIATDLNNKVSKSDLLEVQCVVETYVNGTSGYRIWSDGYCEQWIHKDNWGDIGSFTFLKTFKDTNYIVVFNGRKADSTSNLGITTITTTTINYNNSDTSLNGDLLAKGYLA